MTQSKFEKQCVSIVSLFPDKNPFKKLSYMAKTFREEIMKCFFWKSRFSFLNNFAKFTGKSVTESFFFVNFVKFLRASFLQNTSEQLLLDHKKEHYFGVNYVNYISHYFSSAYYDFFVRLEQDGLVLKQHFVLSI